MHSGGVPWGVPVPHTFFPSGDHGPSPPFYPPPPAGGSHARPQPQMDAVDQRLKEAQRRRQQEYSHALAEQVRQREERKRQEKDRRRHEDAVCDPPVGAHGMGPRDRGLFDGLGEHNPAQRTNFGRGRRENQAAAVAPPVAMNHSMGPQQHLSQYHHAPPTDVQYPHPQQQTAWSGYAEALGFVEPPRHSGDAVVGGNPPPRRDDPWSGPATSQQPPPPPYQQPTYPQQPQQLGGRRLRTDLHTNGGAGGGLMDDAKKQLRLQQQLDMQDALRRQIEDKQRQKLEEKRKREDEERREMEKFEQDQRRQRDEQERQKEEKRRKAHLEEEHFRVQQQQLAAANAAAQEQRHQHQRHHQASPSKTEALALGQHSNNPPLPLAPRNPPPTNLKNPFTNSRAHLFQDPPSPQQTQLHYHPPRPQLAVSSGPQLDHQLNIHAQGQADHHVATLDTRFLIDQYEQVRVELERQRQLVEQLHAQMKIQQQQQQRPSRGETPRDLPTVSDLEQLRQELRDELAQREALHREELDALRRQQEQQQHASRVREVSRHKPEQSPSSSSRDDQPNGARTLVPVRRGPGRRHDAFVQDALQDDGYETSESLDESSGHDTRRGNQRLSPGASQQALRGSQSAASLQCESKLVFFDGRVQPPHHHKATDHATNRSESPTQKESTSETPEVEESRLEDSVSNLIHHHVSTVGSCKQSWIQPDNQRDTCAQPAHRLSERPADLGDDCDDALGFFVQQVDRRTSEPDRYRCSTSLGMCQPGQGFYTQHAADNVFTAVLQDVDDDDQEADSLDGDTLEAIFQRNLRRHEILSGFEAQHQHRAPQPLHWEELHRRLRNVPHEIEKLSIHSQRMKAQAEPSLAASSRWMPSSRPRTETHTWST